MRSIGIRELKARTSAVIREVRRRWPRGVSAVQAVREGRRHL
jgi:hypothetical protein